MSEKDERRFILFLDHVRKYQVYLQLIYYYENITFLGELQGPGGQHLTENVVGWATMPSNVNYTLNEPKLTPNDCGLPRPIPCG